MLDLDKSTWTRVRFGDVAKQSREKVDPSNGSVERYVAGEHMDTDDLKIHRWGEVGDGYLGPAFHRRFRPGQILYGSRRTYLRKVAVADFDGVCANTTFVIDAKPERISPRFLPFMMTSETFHAHSIAESKGSVNPYVNWPDIAKYEFDLPPMNEQERIADLLWALTAAIQTEVARVRQLSALRASWVHEIFQDASERHELVPLDAFIEEGRPICYGVLKPGPEYEGGRMVVDVKDYPHGQVHVEKVRRCDPQIEAAFKRSRLRADDVLLSIRGTIGRVALVPDALDGQNISRDSARLSPDRDRAMPEFLRLVLESPDVQREIRRTTTGLAVKGINVSRIRQLPVPDWPLSRQREAVESAEIIDGGLRAGEDARSSLVDLRQSFLSELFRERP